MKFHKSVSKLNRPYKVGQIYKYYDKEGFFTNNETIYYLIAEIYSTGLEVYSTELICAGYMSYDSYMPERWKLVRGKELEKLKIEML
jgi:hypothetical protein